jgi:predicted dehydrogenase
MPNRETSGVRVLVCGAGSIGLRHIKNLKFLGAEVLVWRSRAELAKKLMDELSVKVFISLDEALEKADAVVIATVTNTHLDLAIKAAKMGKAIFIEKPISNSTNGIKELSDLVLSKKLIVEVGCQLRTHPNLRKLHQLTTQGDYGPLYTYRAVVGQRLENWRSGTDYRKSYSADIQQGGGALLDLIHEIDLVNWLTGPVESVKAHLAHVSDQEMNAEDLVNLILINSNGAIGQVQMDMLSSDYRRGLELVYRNASFYWDYVTGTLICKRNGSSTIIDQTPHNFKRNSLFLTHMKHFLARLIRSDIPPLCSLDDGVVALCIAESARLSDSRDSSVAIKEIAL